MLAAVFGTLVGGIAAYARGRIEELIMRLTDLVLCFPPIILAMAIAAALGIGTINTIIAMLVVWWPKFARLARSLVLVQRSQEYVEAAVVMGLSPARILIRHIMPNSVGPLIVLVTLDVGNAIITFAGLSFLGLGVVPPTPEWGSMVSEGRELIEQWWVAAFPGLAILTVVLGFNFLGDGIRDWLDPRVAAAVRQAPMQDTTQREPSAADGVAEPILDVRDLRTQFFTDAGMVRAVDGVSFSVAAGETLGIVGESGSGKSVTALSLMRLLDEPARIVGGEIRFQGRDVLAMSAGGAARAARRRHRDGVPGPDDVAQSGAADRAPAGRDHAGARPLRRGAGARPRRCRCSAAWASPRRSARSTAIRTSSPAACASASCWRWASPTSRRC